MTKSLSNLAYHLQILQAYIRCPKIIGSLLQMSRCESRLRHDGFAVVLELLDQELQVDLGTARL